MAKAKKKTKKVTIKDGGLGTTIDKFTEKTGIKKLVGDDRGCAERMEKLNELFPKRFKARILTQEEKDAYKEFKANRTLKLTHKQVAYLCELYASVFNRQLWYPSCFNCSGTVRTMLNIIERLDKVYDACDE